jgi:hypothetical protein
LENTVERKICTPNDEDKFYYADIQLGLYLVRGDSVVLLGELEEGGNTFEMHGYEVTLDELERMIRSQQQTSDRGNSRQESIWEFDVDLL